MAFSYSLILALLLLFPGLCAWAGMRAGSETELVSPAPDVPNSTSTLFIIVFGSLVGHILGSGALNIQQLYCQTHACFRVAYDPNIYKVLLTHDFQAEAVPDSAVPIWLVSFLLLSVATGKLFEWLSKRAAYRDLFDPANFGWLNPTVQKVKAGNAVIIAYVVTKTEYNGASIAFEGVVQRLGMDSDQNITMIALLKVDRFLVKITEDGIKRIEVEGHTIQQLQLRAAEIANIALEVVIDPDAETTP